MTPRLHAFAVAAATAVVLAAAAPAPAQTFSPQQRTEIEAIIKDYLIKNPDVLKEVATALEKQEAEASAAKGRQAVKEHAAAIFNSPRQVVVGNPHGDVTLVEFFDYNCGYCKRAHADLKELLANDKNLRVVLKEFPVLGDGSVEAANVAVAVNIVAPDKYWAFHDAMLTERGQANGEKAIAVAEEIGIDKAKLMAAMKSPEIKATIAESYDLANKLALTGTPSYVTPKEVVVGAVGYDALKEKIGVARCGQPTCS
jgi:protein-disulfide isomerase